MRLVAVIFAEDLETVVVHHGVHALDGVVELHLRLFVPSREKLPHSVHLHHAQVSHKCQHGDVPADVVSLLELINDVLQLRCSPVGLCKLFQVREQSPHEANDSAVMHTDADRQRVAGHGIILWHSKLGIRNITDKLVLWRHPRPSVEDQ